MKAFSSSENTRLNDWEETKWIKDSSCGSYGIETDAIISRIVDDGTPTDIDINVYVCYRTANGEEAEAILANPRSDLEEGQRVRIKYHPKMKGNARLV